MRKCVVISCVNVKLLKQPPADFANQGAYELARTYDPQGNRTVGPTLSRLTFLDLYLHALGVLTKPDRSPEAAHEKWVRFISGEIEALHHGWFCVKLHDTESQHPQPTLAEAREQEDQWFNKASVWHRLPRQARSHLGATKLVQHLEEILSELISTRYATIYVYCSRLTGNNVFIEFQFLVSKSGNWKMRLPVN